jgi:uncharacterized membrane protein
MVAASVVPFAVPLGMVLGSKIADAVDKGISNKFIGDVRDELKDGTSVLILMARDSRDHSAQIIERLREFRPRILKSELSPELEVAVSKAARGNGRIRANLTVGSPRRVAPRARGGEGGRA